MTPQLYTHPHHIKLFISNPIIHSCLLSATQLITQNSNASAKKDCERMEECSLSLNILEVVIPSLCQIIMCIPSISKTTVNRLIFKIISLIPFFIRNVHFLCLKCINYFTRELGKFSSKMAKMQYILTAGLYF